MGKRKRMKDRYRRFSFLSDIEGMKNAIGEMRGMFFPKQSELNRELTPEDIHAYCLHYQGKKCLKCATRCPVDAITAENAHDKETCYQKVAQSLKSCNKNYSMDAVFVPRVCHVNHESPNLYSLIKKRSAVLLKNFQAFNVRKVRLMIENFSFLASHLFYQSETQSLT